MGSFPVDVDLRVNMDLKSATAAFQKLQTLVEAAAKGEAGALEKAQKQVESISKTMIDSTSRAARSMETSLRSLERQASMIGKTAVERLNMEEKAMAQRIKGMKNEEEMLKRLKATYDTFRKEAQDEENRRKNSGAGAGTLLFRGARDFFEGRMSYGIMDIGRAGFNLLGGGGMAGGAGLFGAGGMSFGGGAALAIGGITAALGATAAASYEAAKSMGEYAQRVHEVQVVSGLSAREVQQFEYATKVTGQDVSVLERMMKGLTQAVTDTGSQGQRARQTLQGMGIDLLSLRSGGTPTMELLQQISSALERQPNLWLRNEAAIELFKRAGITSLGTLVELNQAMRDTAGIPFLTQQQLDRAREMHKEIALMGTEFDQLINSLKMAAAHTFYVTVKIVREYTGGNFEVEFDPVTGKPRIEPYTAGGRTYPGAYGPIQDLRRQGLTAMTTEGRPPLEYREVSDFLANLQRTNVEAAERRLSELKKTMDELTEKAQSPVGPLGKIYSLEDLKAGRVAGQNPLIEQIREATRAYNEQKAAVDALRDAETNRKSNLEAIRKLTEEIDTKLAHPYGMLEADRMLMAFKARPGATTEQVAAYSAQTDRLRAQEVEVLRQKAIGIGRTESARVSGILLGEPTTPEQSARELGYDAYLKRVTEVFQRQQKLWHDTVGRTNEEFIRATEQLLAADDRLARTRAEGAAKIGYLLGPQNVDTRMAEQRQLYDAAINDAEDEFKRKSAKIAEEYTDQANREIELHALRLEYAGKEAEARNKYMEAWATEIKQQMGEIEKTVEPLYQTLFTQPSKFPQQLRSTLQQAALHPLVSGLSEMTSRALHPLIFGETGTGGIAGSFRQMFGGGRLSDIRLKGDGSLPISGHVIIDGVNTGPSGLIPSGPTGGGGGLSYGGIRLGSSAGIGLDTLATIAGLNLGFQPGTRAVTATGLPRIPTMSFGPSYTTAGYGDVSGDGGYAGGGAPTFEQLGNLPVGRSLDVAGLTLAAAISGGGGGGGGGETRSPLAAAIQKGIGGILGKYIGGSYAGSGGLDRIGTNIAQYGGAITSTAATLPARIQALSTGPAAGTAAGPAVGALGMMLASAGIFGEQRGRFGGLAEAAGGGFLVAGPIGAAVGGAIGLGEMLAGVESPRYEAIRLVKQLYRIDINHSTADQIVGIANQSYAGRVSVAVRSPEVRHMLGLYAAGTGQASLFAQSSNQPHGASLVEAGGTLQQQATYQYGQAYTYSSNLPVYGNLHTNPLSAPGGNMQFSLNIGGQDAARFMTGQVVTPEVVQTQYASAMNSSTGRVSQALMMTEPGAIVS